VYTRRIVGEALYDIANIGISKVIWDKTTIRHLINYQLVLAFQ